MSPCSSHIPLIVTLPIAGALHQKQYPLSFPSETTPTREISNIAPTGLLEPGALTPRRDRQRLSSASGSVDLSEIP
ncbi:hypothetical protein F511_47712 [Dorcoceras hygrometricum]|uniref:Uncharacterized protein n=1 Tax=Dorcoceras hygrometricum TaxID=472368 RepID=A0A2Z6ZWS2_9LAMI|nr:hypothetical protein F511_47712 [Dorcoceras hygrometricum]